MRTASSGHAAVLLVLLAAAILTAQGPAPRPPAAGGDTRDRYLNPRETDLSLAMKVDPAEVPDIPPVEPDKVLETFRIKKGFRIELVAHEPMVVDPIQMAFDEDGRLYVVEMRWYQSETRTDLMFDERIGRIRRLEDVDGDGRFDRSTIFADRLRYPSAVLPYDGGVFVGAEPDLLYLADRNGDGVADHREVVFTGFGNHRERLDSQMFLNSLTWSLDNRIHGVRGHGGLITAPGAAGQEPLDLRGSRDFSFDPRSRRIRAESGGGKQGLTFDDYGRKFVSSANSAVQALMYEDRYASRNPFYTPPHPMVDIALAPGETADRQIVHRISPEDPWRRVRNRWRAEGLFAGPPPQPPTYLIGSAGVTIYRGTALPPECRGDAFVGVAGNNLVHHRRLEPDGAGFRARRLADEAAEEFLASTDLWFRPVAFANGPDGALYIADLYREILDFSDGIPESIKRFKDLNRGNDRGRIYRVVREGFQQPAPARLGGATTADLVAALEHPNAWHRETAARLLYERQDKAAIPALVPLARRSPSPLGRLHALYALEGMGALAEGYVLTALEDADAGVREHGVRLAERFATARPVSGPLWDALARRLEDASLRVRYQLAFTLGEMTHDEAAGRLLALVGRDVELPWMQAAVLTSLGDRAGEIFTRLVEARDASTRPADAAFLGEIIRVLGHRNKGRELLAVLDYLARPREPSLSFPLVAAFADGLRRADVPFALFQPRLQPIVDRALSMVGDSRASEAQRLQAIDVLGLTASTGDTARRLLALVGTGQPNALQSAAIRALSRLDGIEVARELLSRWHAFTPALRREILPGLLGRPERAMSLLEAVEAGTVQRGEFTPTQVAGLRAHRQTAIRTRAAAIFEPPAPNDRRAVVQRYLPALDLRGNATRGRTTYVARCAACHDAGTDGRALGPSLGTLRALGHDELLTHLIDPNRAVDAAYRLHVVETTDGQTISGIISNDSGNSVTIRPPGAPAQTWPRSRIVRLQAMERSLMPEGLEEGLSLQDMADVLQFVREGGER